MGHRLSPIKTGKFTSLCALRPPQPNPKLPKQSFGSFLLLKPRSRGRTAPNQPSSFAGTAWKQAIIGSGDNGGIVGGGSRHAECKYRIGKGIFDRARRPATLHQGATRPSAGHRADAAEQHREAASWIRASEKTSRPASSAAREVTISKPSPLLTGYPAVWARTECVRCW
jgi:hypothetical protein